MSTVQQFDLSVDAVKALMWEHDNAEHLKSLVLLKQAWYEENQEQFWQQWVSDVFNIDTANSFGLAVWARILDIPLYVISDADQNKFAFGFGPSNANFENGNFANRSANQLGLTLEQRRLVIRLRYFQLTCRGAIPEINAFLADIFSDVGKVYAIDNLDMTMTYFFQFQPSRQLLLVLDNYDLLPRPSGVKVNYQFQPKASFGFGIEHLNYENGNFGA